MLVETGQSFDPPGSVGMLAARSISTPINSLVRQLSYTRIRAAPESKKAPNSRTRKKREELPETLLSPSGRPVAPLAEWDGGLTGRSTKCE